MGYLDPLKNVFPLKVNTKPLKCYNNCLEMVFAKILTALKFNMHISI